MTGATLSKGLLRGVGTILGGGLGCLAAIMADDLGKIGNAVVVGASVFIFGKQIHKIYSNIMMMSLSMFVKNQF